MLLLKRKKQNKNVKTRVPQHKTCLAKNNNLLQTYLIKNETRYESDSEYELV